MAEEQDEDEKQRRKRLLLFAYRYYLSLKKKKYFFQNLNLEGRLRHNRGLNRGSLVDPKLSPWQKLYDSRDNPALITVTGLDHDAFAELLKLYEPLYNEYTPWTGQCDGTTYRRLRVSVSKGRGRKRIISAAASLGLVLAWYRFRGAEFILQGWFGFTHTHNNVWLRFGRRMLLKALRRHPEAQIKIPDDEEIKEMKKICLQRHDALENVYCFADGLKLMLEQAGDDDIQGMYYNAWTHDHYVTNVFVFSICGRIIAGVVNAPGCLHDSTLADWGGVYELLHEVYIRTGGICCVDSAFQSEGCDYLIRSAQDTTKAKNELELIQITQATSLRQAAEWGMHAIQSSMPRLKDRFPYEEEDKAHRERDLILRIVPLLYNFRLEFVGLNQIRSTYIPSWSKDADYYIA